MPAWSIDNFIRTPLLLMAVIELLIPFSSVYVAALIVFGDLALFEEALGPLVPKAATVSVVILVSLISMGLYQLNQRIYFREAAVRVLVGLVIGSAALAVIFYSIPSMTLSPEITGLAVVYALALLLIVRYYFVRNVDENIFRRRTLIYGAGERADSISDLRRRADRRGFKIVGRISAPGDTTRTSKKGLTTDGKSITDIAIEHEADEIVVAMDDRRGNLPIQELLDSKLRGIEVIDLLEFLERETGKIRVDLVNPGWLIFSPGFRTSRFRRFNKRLVDIIVSSSLLLLTWPLMLLITLAIKIEDGFGAPVLYRQRRVGQKDEPISVPKFRSMRTNAEPDGQAVWAEENDSRITRVGSILRTSRLDELPQFINVLRGQMSLVGPRPERPEFVEKLKESIPYYSERHTVKPGVTGWAQLRYSYGSTEEGAIEKLQYDLYYVKNQSLMLDIMIILQTVEVILWGKGAR